MLRVGSNFARLGANFAIGLLLVRLLLDYEVTTYSIYVLVVVGFGFGIMLKELARIAIIPSLASHLADREAFASAYASSFVVAAGFALLGAVIMLSLIPFLSMFSIPDARLGEASIFIVARAGQTALSVLLAPLLNYLLLQRRFVLSNLLLISERVIELLSVLPLVMGLRIIGDGLAQVGILGLLGLSILYAAVGIVLVWKNRDLAPNPKRVSPAAVGKTMALCGWTPVLVMAMNLFIRFDVVFVNAALGTLMTAMFAVAVQGTGMLQQVTNGLVGGTDANISHMIAKSGSPSSAVPYLQKLSQLQIIVVGALCGLIFALASKLLELWLGETLGRDLDPDLLVVVLRIMLVGIAIRGVAEVWMQAMNGIGSVGTYSRWLLLAALANPFLVLAGLFLFSDPGDQLIWVAVVFSVLHILAYGIGVPVAVRQVFETKAASVIAPAIWPIAIYALLLMALMAVQNGASGLGALAFPALCVFVFTATPGMMLLLNRKKVRS